MSADSADSCGICPLMDAARGDHVMVLEFLLDVCNADVSTCDVLGRCGLHHAAQAGAGQAVRCLVSRGADVNQPASVNGITPLHYAAKVSPTFIRLLDHKAPSVGRSGCCHSNLT